ncbi:WHG domain-containing protein [Intrasporangium sp. YIM S08009]|uniref:WHG domain-containing protein n=1 Tax=Intrasporangium zincisolvens TaxID=3080018 RepID=UPI002B05967C|nr:WHG domain-containing protein [Intrasporangium sp. YIM S08009]
MTTSERTTSEPTDAPTDAPPDARTEEPTAAEPLGRRARNRMAIEADILRVARQHLATSGAAALSLRAVARDLGMVSSGIYRYVESRDELLTRLIVDGYTSLAAAVTTAHDDIDPDDLGGRWEAVAHALRAWALEHPHDFALLYGSPVPDYTAPADRTTEPGTAVLALVTRIVDGAARAGRGPTLAPALERLADAGVGAFLQDDFFAGTAIEAGALAQGLSAWTLVLGAVTSEVFDQLGPVPDAGALFAWHVAVSRRLVVTD